MIFEVRNRLGIHECPDTGAHINNQRLCNLLIVNNKPLGRRLELVQ